MAFTAFNHSVSVVGFERNNTRYCMTCAWAMQADYNKVLLLIGAQSVTGSKIMKGDIIGVSALSKYQKDIALQIGENHSDACNKLEGIQYNVSDDALFIMNAARLMKVRVIDILHLKGIEEDSLVYGEIIEKVETVFPFLNMSDI